MAETTTSHSGRSIDIVFDSARCIHAGYCVRSLPQVFNGKRTPWIDAHGADADAIARTIEECPSGALSYRYHHGETETEAEINQITVEADGPLRVEAGHSIDGEKQYPPRATLCRCGGTRNPPYCDNSHQQNGFSDAGTPPPFNPEAEVSKGLLDIRPLARGPLYLVGPHRICSSSGEPIRVCDKSALCRCGASQSKPYCDGSHAGIGFDPDA